MSDLRAQCEAAYKKKVVETVTNVVRLLTMDAFTGVVLATPVKSGRARAQWNVSVNRIDYTVTSKTEQKDIKYEVLAVTNNAKMSDTFYLTNNLPYIKRLNNGYSKQAPSMFVEKAVLIAENRAKGKTFRTEVEA